MAISDNIRTIRKKKGLTQKQVAEACGMFDTAIRAYELGKANPKPATVARIAKALDVSPAELYGVDWIPGADAVSQETGSALFQSVLNDQGGTLPIDDPNKARLLMAFDKLNKEGQTEAIKRIDELSQLPAYQLHLIPPEYKHIGERIKTEREQRQLSYSQLGEMCQLSAEDIQNIELGKKVIPLQAMKYISSNLGIRMTDLFVLTSEEQERTKKCYGALELLDDMERNSTLTDDSRAMIQHWRPKIDHILETICDAAAERILKIEGESKA